MHFSHAQIDSCRNTWYYGEGTAYGGIAGSSGGHCGIPVEAGDIYHAAMNHIQYANSDACGTCVRILGPKGEVTLKIADECPECKFGDIDMTTGVFPQLAEWKEGRIKIKWQYVPCPKTGDITLFFDPSSGPYYFKVQVRDPFYPVTKFEYLRSDGNYDTVNRVDYNYYVKEGGIDNDKSKAGPYTFRLTASTGEVIVIKDVVLTTSEPVHTGNQFALAICPDCAGVLSGTAKLDNCGVCSGGNTGIAPNSTCEKDCYGYWEGTAYLDGCAKCVAGTTGATPCDNDCNGDPGGLSFKDRCGNCVGGKTSLKPCLKDCHNDWGGKAFIDSCGKCAGGNTFLEPVTDPTACKINPSSLEKADLKKSLSVENPVMNEITIHSDDIILKLRLFGLSGNLISETNSEKMNVISLPPGMYLVSVITNKGIQLKRVIKE